PAKWLSINQSAFWAGFMDQWLSIRSGTIMRVPRAPHLIAVALFRALLRRTILLRRVFGSILWRRVRLLRRVCRLRLRGFQVVDDLLQGNDICLQGFDLRLRGVEFLLMVEAELGDCFLQKLDIALQTTGT